MLTRLSLLPIFQRLFLAFALAALLPIVILVLILSISTQFLEAHGGAALAASLRGYTILGICGSLGIVLVLGFLVNLSITRPLVQLAALARKIRRGETNARATVTGQDEISIVASSINNMLDDIVRLVQQTQGQHDYLQSQVERLINEVSGVGEGDLRVQAVVTPDSLGTLADSFNYMVEELSRLIIEVMRVAGEVASSTTVTQQQVNHLASTAAIQLQQIDRTGRTVQTMANESLQVAKQTQMLEKAAQEALVAAQTGRSTVAQTLDGIGHIQSNVQRTAIQVQRLGERSREINAIVEIINTIVHQTNRLSLDASIQAAMAGENGKGFGAVAADIRRLSETAKEQMSMITRIVNSVLEDIEIAAVSMHETEKETEGGTRFAHNTGATLSKIFAIVEQQAQEVESINIKMGNLYRSSQEVTAIMQDVFETTQQSNNNTSIIEQKMYELANLANQLRISVGAFKLKDAPSSSGQWSQPMSATDGRQGIR